VAVVVTRFFVPYTMLSPPGWPIRPFLTGSAAPYGQTIEAGATVALLEPEAAALIAAGAAERWPADSDIIDADNPIATSDS
jgi:hypothetical protein